MSDLVGATGKAGPRRTKGLGIGDPGGVTMQRKGDALANQDTCLAALRSKGRGKFRSLLLGNGMVNGND